MNEDVLEKFLNDIVIKLSDIDMRCFEARSQIYELQMHVWKAGINNIFKEIRNENACE